eukprot:gene36471-biopygen6593
MKRGAIGQLHLTTEREARLQNLVDEGKLIWDMSLHDDARWDVMYNLLVDYGTRNGTCNVPQREKSSVLPDGSSVNLGLWVRDQRQRKDTTMKSERRARLQTLDEIDSSTGLSVTDSMGSLNSSECEVEKRGRNRKGNRKTKGRTKSVPVGAVTKHEGKKAQLSVLKQRWFKTDMPEKDVVWNSHCDILEEYWRLFGTCNCPAGIVCVLPGGREVNIGKWLDNQRQKKRGTRGRGIYQTTEREARLQALVDEGKLIWDMSLHDDARWDVMYNLLVDYGTRNGTCNVPQKGKSSVLPDGSSVNLEREVIGVARRQFRES